MACSIQFAFSSKSLFTFSSLIASLRPGRVSLHPLFTIDLHLHLRIILLGPLARIKLRHSVTQWRGTYSSLLLAVMRTHFPSEPDHPLSPCFPAHHCLTCIQSDFQAIVVRILILRRNCHHDSTLELSYGLTASKRFKRHIYLIWKTLGQPGDSYNASSRFFVQYVEFTINILTAGMHGILYSDCRS